MLSHDRVHLLESLRDDCDVLIAMLIRDEGARTVPAHTSERMVKLLRQPRLLFDVAEGWPALEDVSEAMNLSHVLVNELASELEKLGAWFDANNLGVSTLAERHSRTSNTHLVSPQQVVASLRAGSAEVPLWKLRHWLDRRIMSMNVALLGKSKVARPATGRIITPPRLQPFNEGPSLGVRSVGDDRLGLVEAVLLERANAAHEAVLQAMRGNLVNRGGECFQSVLIDLACIVRGSPHIVEAKSISPDNEVEQVRHAFAQLRDYRFRHRAEEPFVGREVCLWVALSSIPQDGWAADFLRHEKILLVWLGKDGKLAGPDIHVFEAMHST